MSGFEIFGTVVAVGGVLDKARVCYDIIKQLKRAPHELALLLSELSFAQVVLSQAQKQLEALNGEHIGEGTSLQEWVAAVAELGKRADAKIDEIRELIGRVSENRNGKLYVKRVRWMLEANSVTEIRLGLQRTREEFGIALGIAHGQNHLQAIDRLDRLAKLAEVLSERTDNKTMIMCAQEDTIRGLCQAFEDSAQFDGDVRKRRNSSSSPSVGVQEVLSHEENLELGPAVTIDSVPSHDSITDEFTALRPRRRSSSSDASIALPVIRYRNLPMRSQRDCPAQCRCVCHRSRRLSTPRTLNTVAGSCSVTVSGWNTLSRSCNMLGSCNRSLDWSSHVTYVFPTWFVSKAVAFRMRAGPMGEPELQLRTRRIAMTDAYRLAQVGDVEGLDSLYHERKASVYDVHPQEGQSALLVAIWCGQAEVVRYLLGKNAMMEEETFDGLETTDAVIRHVYGRVSTPGTVGLLSHLFRVDEMMDDQQFNIVHKIVLGLAASRDLVEECKEHPELVDESDLRGRTSLWWAALRLDIDSCKTLLEFGAKPNAADYQGETVMQNAAASARDELVALLLEHGAEIGHGSGVSETPLHYAARSNGRAKTVQLLLEKHADPNASNIHGVTPSHECIEVDAIDVAKLLRKHGAKLDVRDASGETYAHMAIRCRASRVLQYLIAEGCNLSLLGGEGQSILHTASRYADEQVVGVLMEASLSDVDPDLLDSHRLTAAMCVAQRLADAKREEAEHEADLGSLLERMIAYAHAQNADAVDGKEAESTQSGTIDPLPGIEASETAVIVNKVITT